MRLEFVYNGVIDLRKAEWKRTKTARKVSIDGRTLKLSSFFEVRLVKSCDLGTESSARPFVCVPFSS